MLCRGCAKVYEKALFIKGFFQIIDRFSINLLAVSYLPLQEQAPAPPAVFVVTGCARYFGVGPGEG